MDENYLKEVNSIQFSGRAVGSGFPCFIIAEAGVNHNGSLDMARQLIDAAAEAGADAVKFQTFNAEKLVGSGVSKAEYQLKTTDPDESQLTMLRRLEFSMDSHRVLRDYSDEKGILFLSTPFDQESVDLLDQLGIPVFKISSGDITNWPLLKYIAKKGKPIILSTGMSYLEEVSEAIRLIFETGNDQVSVLHCVSNYPANPEDINLQAMATMAKSFRLPVGYSDHTLGIEISFAAVACGACIIEKHFTLDRALPGPDHAISILPQELAALTRGVRLISGALGNGEKIPAKSEKKSREVARRSLVASCDIAPGTVIEEPMILCMRPGTGLSPIYCDWVIGRRAKVKIMANQLIAREMFE